MRDSWAQKRSLTFRLVHIVAHSVYSWQSLMRWGAPTRQSAISLALPCHTRFYSQIFVYCYVKCYLPEGNGVPIEYFPVVQKKRQQSSYSGGYFVVLEADKDGEAGQRGGGQPEGPGSEVLVGGSRFLSLLKWARVSSLAPDKPNVDRVDKLILILLVRFGPKMT